MAYTPKTWTAASYITATALNHLESQYDTLYDDYLNGHTHDTRYYTKATADTTFYWSVYMGSGSGADGDLLDGHHASEVVGTGFPIGSIIMWGQLATAIPTGWSVCNGSGATVDLRNYFVPCAGDSYTVGQTMGASSATPVSDTISIADTTLTTNQIPMHTHSYSDYYGNSDTAGAASAPPTVTVAAHIVYDTNSRTTSTDGGTGGGHNHTSGTSVTYNSESNLPKYYALYYIQRMS